MLNSFQPRLDILPSAQRCLWGELVEVPESFTLYGGTAIALYLGHRISVDFDFFGNTDFDPDDLYNTIPFLKAAEVLQKSSNTLTCLVERGEPVQVSFFGVPEIKAISPPLITDDIHLKVASLVDLAGMKAAVIQKRAEAKDYIDLDALIQQSKISLSTALAAGQYIYGKSFNPQITLKALSYFEDGNLQQLDSALKNRLIQAIKTVELSCLPNLIGDAS